MRDFVLGALSGAASCSLLLALLVGRLERGRPRRRGGYIRPRALSGRNLAVRFTTPLTLRVEAYSSSNPALGSLWVDPVTQQLRPAPSKSGAPSSSGEPADGNRGRRPEAAG